MGSKTFTKPPLTLEKQVELLQQRGMQISDWKLAERSLLNYNYYRFCGYALHFEIFDNHQRTHQYRPGTTFEDVLRLYDFDTRLRALLFTYIEPIEVAFRSIICYEMSMLTGKPHWYLEKRMYRTGYDLSEMQKKCEAECTRSNEIFIRSYNEKYSSPGLPPAWMMSEILGFGFWSRVYKNLADTKMKKSVAQHFNIPPHYLESWLHSLSVLRNLCAHHCKIWNRAFDVKPTLPNSMKLVLPNNTKLSAQILILEHLLQPVDKEKAFQQDWNNLLKEYHSVPRSEMGL